MATGSEREDRIGDVTPEMLMEWASLLDLEKLQLTAYSNIMRSSGKSVATIDGFSKFKRAKQALVELRGNLAKGIALAPTDAERENAPPPGPKKPKKAKKK